MSNNIINNKMEAYNTLKSFQLGGAINMTEEKKKELFPYFAYLYSQKINPDKYGQATSLEEWTTLIQDNPEDIELITNAAGELSNDDWDSLAQQYEVAQSDQSTESPQLAAKGAKLKVLRKQKGGNTQIPPMSQLKKIQKENTGVQSNKEGAKVKKKKKCSCGCDMILTKAAGGKVMEVCSCKCGGKMKKKK